MQPTAHADRAPGHAAVGRRGEKDDHARHLVLGGEPPDRCERRELIQDRCWDALAVQQILDALEACPAYVVNARWDAVAWNEAACRVFTDFATLSPRDRNLLRFMFMHPLVARRRRRPGR